MNTPTIVGIHGKAGSGKDTLASFILEAHMDSGLGVGDRYAFADPVKEAASAMFGVDISDFHDRERKEIVDDYWQMSPRVMAQLVGTDMARDVYNKNIWIKRAEYFIKNVTPANLIVVTDVRFENEAEWIRNSGGKLIHITRPDLEEIEASGHASEQGVSYDESKDFEFVNGGTLDELKLLGRLFHSAEINPEFFGELELDSTMREYWQEQNGELKKTYN